MCSKCMQELRQQQQQQQQQQQRQQQRSHSSSPHSNGTTSRQPGSSSGSSSQPPFVWTCCSPICPGAPQQQQQQQSSGLSGGRLWCLPGAAPLQLLLQLPRDLVKPQQVVTDQQQQQQGRLSLTPVAPGQPCGGISSRLTTLYTRLHSIAQVWLAVQMEDLLGTFGCIQCVTGCRSVLALQQAAGFLLLRQGDMKTGLTSLVT